MCSHLSRLPVCDFRTPQYHMNLPLISYSLLIIYRYILWIFKAQKISTMSINPSVSRSNATQDNAELANGLWTIDCKPQDDSDEVRDIPPPKKAKTDQHILSRSDDKIPKVAKATNLKSIEDAFDSLSHREPKSAHHPRNWKEVHSPNFVSLRISIASV